MPIPFIILYLIIGSIFIAISGILLIEKKDISFVFGILAGIILMYGIAAFCLNKPYKGPNKDIISIDTTYQK